MFLYFDVGHIKIPAYIIHNMLYMYVYTIPVFTTHKTVILSELHLKTLHENDMYL